MEFISNFIWEKNDRAQNEDALCFRHAAKEGKEYLLAVVCDGIGGLPEGENASSFVADNLGKELMRQLEIDKNMSMRKWRNVFLRKIYQCHQMLRMYGKERGIRLGTTVSMVFLCGSSGWIIQAGDSAVFTGIRRLRRKTGIHRTKKGALRKAVGTGREPQAECKRLYVRKGSVILLASDGFYQRTEREITNKEDLKELKTGGKGLKKAKETVSEMELRIGVWLRNRHRTAMQRGERDNASAICVVCR